MFAKNGICMQITAEHKYKTYVTLQCGTSQNFQLITIVTHYDFFCQNDIEVVEVEEWVSIEHIVVNIEAVKG